MPNPYSSPWARIGLGTLVVLGGPAFSRPPARGDDEPPAAGTPRDVDADELAGRVIDPDGRPIEGVEIDAWHWVPGNVTRTDRDGVFRLKKLPKGTKVTVRVRKEGYETQYHLERNQGPPGWLVVLGNRTYFEGRVLRPDGSPAADVLIRADSGPRRGQGFMMTDCISETRSGTDGRYRLHVEPGHYDFELRAPGAGVARFEESIDVDQHRTRDIRLTPGVTFVARAVDSQTGQPVPGVRLWHWQKPGIEGTTGPDGKLEIRDAPPGKYPRFQVEAKGYARWWSDACLSEWSRFEKANRHGFQRNFDGLDFEMTSGMDPVTITLERAATITGRVLDPDGKPVAGATVAPALTGSGNSLTGDTRFSVETDAQGRFTSPMPASGDIEYNLVAHDGKYQQWRNWANGILPPFRTRPGEEVRDVTIRLERPATVRGRVVDEMGGPVMGLEVRSTPVDAFENRYYDPTTKTEIDGSFELRFVRPCEQFIQVAPFWLDPKQGPKGTSKTITLKAGETKEGVDFKIHQGEPK